MIKQKSCFICLCCIISGSTVAASNDNDNDVMVVSASREMQSLWKSPVSIDVITRDQLEKSTGDSIAEALRDIPGIEISDNALTGRKQIMIRGESVSRVLVLIDGQESTYHRAGHNSGLGLMIDPSLVERIEVVKGPHSVLYGSQAIAGVINFITVKGGDKPVSSTFSAVWDSATAGWQESALVHGSIGNFDYRLNASYAEHGNRKTPDGRLNDTNFSNNGESIWLGYHINKHDLGVSLDRYKLSTQTYEESGDYNYFSVKIPELVRKKVGVFYDFNLDTSIVKKIHVDAYHQWVNREFRNNMDMDSVSADPSRNINMLHASATDDEQKTDGITLQANLQITKQNSMIVGGQYLRDKVTNDNSSHISISQLETHRPIMNSLSTSAQKWQQESWSIFGQNTLQITDDFVWTVGVRQNWVDSKQISGVEQSSVNNRPGTIKNLGSSSSNGHATVVATTLTYSGIENTVLRMSYAQGYVFPTLSHMFYTTDKGGQTLYGNPDLDAEHSNNYELGLRYRNDEWLLDTAVYFSDAKDYIASISCNGSEICKGSTSKSATYYANANKAQTYGAELSVEYHGWSWSPYINGNFIHRELTLTNKKTSDVGEPRLTGKVGVRNTQIFDMIEFESDFFVRAASSAKNKTSATTIEHEGWATANASFTSRIGSNNQYRVSLNLNNLTDKRYKTAHESVPAAGFNVAIGFGFKF